MKMSTIENTLNPQQVQNGWRYLHSQIVYCIYMEEAVIEKHKMYYYCKLKIINY